MQTRAEAAAKLVEDFEGGQWSMRELSERYDRVRNASKLLDGPTPSEACATGGRDTR